MERTLLDDILTPNQVAAELAHKVKQCRLSMRLTQAELATKAGITLATYRRFEQSAQISLQGLLQVAFALDCLRDFDSLFARKWQSIDDMLNDTNPPKRVRRDRH